MVVSTTLFKSIYDNRTDTRLVFKNFDAFEESLYQLSKRPIASKKDAPLMSPAVYMPETTRANANVIEWAQANHPVDHMQEVITKNISEQKIPTNEDVSEMPWA